MRRASRPTRLLLALATATSFGCGPLELPLTLALVGDNSITLAVPAFPPPDNVFGSTLVGGVDATAIVRFKLRDLLSPRGVAVAIVVDRVRLAAEPIDLLGLDTGVVCVFDDGVDAGGGFLFFRPLRKQADVTLTLDTRIAPTAPLLQAIFPDPLPFEAAIDQTIRITLSEVLGLLAGGGAGFELSQRIRATLPPEIPILGGSIVTADVTFASADAIPSSPLLDHCEDFLAGL